MIHTYYSTFIVGLLKPVTDGLKSTVPDCNIRLGLDGLVVFETSASREHVAALPFVANTFELIKMFPKDKARTIADLAQGVLKERDLNIRLPSPKKKKGHTGTYRVITSVANKLVPISPALMQKLEATITQRTGARPDRARPDTELWILQRTEGYGFFSVRISTHKAYDKVLERGELRPDLAYILCLLSQPKAGQLFLDPFCGSGAVALQRAHFPVGLIIASDADCDKIERLKEKVRTRGLKHKIVVRCEDALHLTRYSDGAIHAIVTDPPWGHFEKLQISLATFYRQLIDECLRLLAPKGKLVILTGEPTIFEGCLHHVSDKCDVDETFQILVSGKKATIFVISRKQENRILSASSDGDESVTLSQSLQ